MERKFGLRDLITLAIFAVILLVLDFAIGMLTLTIAGLIAFPAVFALVSGPVTIFYMRKEPRPWMTFAVWFILCAVLTAMGHSWVYLVQGIVFALLAEFVRRSFGYYSEKGLIWSHIFGCLGNLGFYFELFLLPVWYRQASEALKVDPTLTEKTLALPWWIMIVVAISIVIFGYIGAKFGVKITDKHFKKAGMVD